MRRFLMLLLYLTVLRSSLGYWLHYIDSNPHYKSSTVTRKITSTTYSAHNCVGNANSGIDDSTRCHFRNVCVELNDSIGDIDTPVVPFWTPRPSSVRMTYYRPAVAFGKPLYWSGSTNLVRSQLKLDTGC
jgi:hypothetical protein